MANTLFAISIATFLMVMVTVFIEDLVEKTKYYKHFLFCRSWATKLAIAGMVLFIAVQILNSNKFT